MIRTNQQFAVLATRIVIRRLTEHGDIRIGLVQEVNLLVLLSGVSIRFKEQGVGNVASKLDDISPIRQPEAHR